MNIVTRGTAFGVTGTLTLVILASPATNKDIELIKICMPYDPNNFNFALNTCHKRARPAVTSATKQ